jgi:dipeptidase E
MSRLLLISNSTGHGKGYLDHVETELQEFVGKRSKIVFVPLALFDRHRYTVQAATRLNRMGFEVTSVHDVSNPQRAVREAEAIFVGGGNTFRLLKGLYDWNLVDSIQQAVAAGIPYIGSSAGAIVACPSLRTTKDMPVVQPPSFDALRLVNFQISPHYLDPDPASTHMGETQEERINQFLEENDAPVVGLREGSFLRVEPNAIHLRGPHSARIFRRGSQPLEAPPEMDLFSLLAESESVQGRAA